MDFIIISGDPNDRTLRRVEKDVLVPKLMRERTKTEKCVNEVKGNVNYLIYTKTPPYNNYGFFLQNFTSVVSNQDCCML